MWQFSSSAGEIFVRALVIYVGLFLLFRLTGKKQLGEMSPFDFVLLLIVSESVSNALSGEDNSIAAGILSATTLILLNNLMDRLAYNSKKFENWIEGEPQLLVVDGQVRKNVLVKEKITESEFQEALREHGIENLRQIRYAVLEPSGKVSVVRDRDLDQKLLHREQPTPPDSTFPTAY